MGVLYSMYTRRSMFIFVYFNLDTPNSLEMADFTGCKFAYPLFSDFMRYFPYTSLLIPTMKSLSYTCRNSGVKHANYYHNERYTEDTYI